MSFIPASASPRPPYAMVLVTYNRKERLKVVLEHLNAQTLHPVSLVVIDNHSTDGTAEFLSSVDLKFPFRVITAAGNGGHGAGLALGLAAIQDIPGWDFVLLLEDDSFPAPGLAEHLLEFSVRHGINVLCLDGFLLKLGKRLRPRTFEDRPVAVDFALLDGTLIGREVLHKVGLPRTDFFMMCDDLEYSIRIKESGFKAYCIKTDLHRILHLGGERGFTRTMLWRGYYQARNGMHILKENFSWYGLLDYTILELKRLIGCLPARDRFYRMGLRLLGIWHGLIGKFGKTLDPANF